VTEGHNLDKTILGQPPALFHHVIEHHRDLRDRPADVDETEKKKIEKHFAPRRHLMVCVGIVLLICR
jgi:hypothetical protein